jgi:hypothetical protein
MQLGVARKNLFAALLLAISVIAFTPALAHANQQQSQAITIDSTGQPTANNPSGATTTIASNDSASYTSLTNQTQNGNSTLAFESSYTSQNATETNVTNATTTDATNSTLLSGVGNNTATTASPNASARYIPQTSGNITVTATQYVSVTTSSTVTVENATISYTVTTTVANTTITEGNVTTTLTVTTGT